MLLLYNISIGPKFVTYSVTSVGGVRATLVAFPSAVVGRSIELRVTAGFGEPG